MVRNYKIKKMKFRIVPSLLVCLLISVQAVLADSPLTSIYFSANYPEYPIIEKTGYDRTFNDEVAAFLLDKTKPIDAKAALINALGWNYDQTKNAELFRERLAKKYAATTSTLKLSSLNADELMCLGYLMAMDNYFAVDDAINILEMAKSKKPTSFTISIILAMTRAQKAMETDFCKVWTLTTDVLNDKSLKRDMKRNSIQNTIDHMILYKSYCYAYGE